MVARNSTSRSLRVQGCAARVTAMRPPGKDLGMAADTLEEQLVKYLTDAHSIEVQALAQMRSAPGLASFPGLADAFKEHEAETERHEQLVRSRLEAHGASPSRVKDAVMAVGGKGFVLFARSQPDTDGKLATHACRTSTWRRRRTSFSRALPIAPATRRPPRWRGRSATRSRRWRIVSSLASKAAWKRPWTSIRVPIWTSSSTSTSATRTRWRTSRSSCWHARLRSAVTTPS